MVKRFDRVSCPRCGKEVSVSRASRAYFRVYPHRATGERGSQCPSVGPWQQANHG